MLIIQTQPMIIFTRLLEILVIKCLLLVVDIQVNISAMAKSKSLTSTRTHGQQKLLSRIAYRMFEIFKFISLII